MDSTIHIGVMDNGLLLLSPQQNAAAETNGGLGSAEETSVRRPGIPPNARTRTYRQPYQGDKHE